MNWFSRTKKEERAKEREEIDRVHQAAERTLIERRSRLEELIEQMKEERQAKT